MDFCSIQDACLICLSLILVLAIFVGFEVISKVPSKLHTPLMSGSNAISGITLVGAILTTGTSLTKLSSVLGTLAVIFATINVVGGYLVTDRMLKMFEKKPEKERK
jgi:NAD(P) transhydrogenase subunit alpha